MSKLLRYFQPGQTCFITSVTASRRPVLADNATLLLRAIQSAKCRSEFDTIAWVILPDHFHAIIASPLENMSTIIQRIKLSFSLQLNHRYGTSGSVWQRRFWDHVIRSEDDFKKHVDYIHYNPAKHGFVKSPEDWPYSSLHRFSELGLSELNWEDKLGAYRTDDFGE